jgi:hypothetical protein
MADLATNMRNSWAEDKDQEEEEDDDEQEDE